VVLQNTFRSVSQCDEKHFLLGKSLYVKTQ